MSAEADSGPKSRRRLLALLPLALFLVLAGIFLMQLLSGRDLSTVPSALIGAPAPETRLPPVEGLGLPGLDSAQFVGNVTLVNVWASWCAPCREEHPVLMALADDPRLQVLGINYKDVPENARRFLGELGNPYAAVGVDESGRTAIDWGVYGVPETFLVGPDGVIRRKFIGPLTAQAVTEVLMPDVAALSAGK